MSPDRPAIWNRDFTLLWVTNFLMATSFYFLLPTFTAYLYRSFYFIGK